MPDYALVLSEAEISRYRMMADWAERHERDLWVEAGAVPGARIADVGCGPGAIAVRLASMAGPDGEVWAVDQDPQALAAATELAAHSGVALRTKAGDAAATGLQPDAFDLVMMRMVLAHNGGSEQAIVDHLATLARPEGGSVYLVDIYARGSQLRRRDSDRVLDDLTERYAEFHRRRGDDLDVGARLDELLTNAGLVLEHFGGRIDIVTLPAGQRGPAWAARDTLVAEGLAEPEDIERWDQAYRRADHPATFFAAYFIAYARRP